MDKNIIKIICLIVGLIALVATLVYVLLQGFSLGPIKAVSVTGIGEKNDDVAQAKADLKLAEAQYDVNVQNLDIAKKEFNTQKEAYELISDEKIAAVKEATKEEEYLIEYLWITLGNYATAHDLELAIVEPGGNVNGSGASTSQTTTDVTDVSTETGVSGNSTGVTSNGSQNTGDETEEEPSVPLGTGMTASADALTVQVKGSYIDLADFVFEVENDKSLRFRLDNIKMQSAGGTDVLTSFNVKDFTVLKYLE